MTPCAPPRSPTHTQGAPRSNPRLLSPRFSVFLLLWAELYPHTPNSYVEVLLPVPQNVALFRVTADVISSGEVIREALIQCDWAPHDRDIRAEMLAQGECHVNPKTAPTSQAERPQKEPGLPTPYSWASGLQICETRNGF